MLDDKDFGLQKFRFVILNNFKIVTCKKFIKSFFFFLKNDIKKKSFQFYR